MQRFIVLLLLSGLLAIGSASTAVAAPSEVSASFGPKAQFVSPTTLLLPATYTCPATFGTAFISASVSQSDTGGTGSGFDFVAPCTGSPETIVLVINGGPFTLGQAVVNGFAFAGGQFDQDIRRIQITL